MDSDEIGGAAGAESRIAAKTRKIEALAAETDTARRLQTMPGVGPLTALAVEAFAPDMTSFKSGRDFAAWLGLVPRQRSSGGKERLGRVSKAGQADTRRLLIVGAMSRLNWFGRKSIPEGSWLARMLAGRVFGSRCQTARWPAARRAACTSVILFV
jgi:transposase